MIEGLFTRLLRPSVLYVTQGIIDGVIDPSGPLKTIIPVRERFLSVSQTLVIFCVQVSDVSMVKQCCALYAAMAPAAVEEKAESKSDGKAESKSGENKEDADIIESFFILAIVWSVGGALVASAREKVPSLTHPISSSS